MLIDDYKALRAENERLTAENEQHCHLINRLYEHLRDIREAAQDGIGEFPVLSDSNLLPDIFDAIKWKDWQIGVLTAELAQARQENEQQAHYLYGAGKWLETYKKLANEYITELGNEREYSERLKAELAQARQWAAVWKQSAHSFRKKAILWRKRTHKAEALIVDDERLDLVPVYEETG